MPYEDKTLSCLECGTNFEFSAGEQEFYATKGFSDPRRCPACRRLRRNQQYDDSGGRQLYPIVCAQCGANAEVPFIPRGDRPVYCESCYSQVSSGFSRRSLEE